MSQLDILLIKPGSQAELYGKLAEERLTGIEPPLFAALIAGFLRQRGHGVDILDMEVEGLSPAEVGSRVETSRPSIVALVVSGTNPSASTMNMVGARTVLDHLDDIGYPGKTLIMGLHPTALPERTMTEEKVDFLVQGEGFVALDRLIRLLKTGADEFAINGLWYRKDEKILANPLPVQVKDLDSLPDPAWDLLPMTSYRAHNWHCFDKLGQRQPYAVISTSFGCPYRCSFCCINALFGRAGIRYRSPERVVNELVGLVADYGIRNVKILDELFVLKEGRVRRICEMLIERNLDLNIWAYARVNTVSPDLLGLMKRAGFSFIAYGFESASEKVLGDVGKGVLIEQSSEAVRMTHDAGLSIIANFMFGLPEDNLTTMEQTLDLALEFRCAFVNFNCTMAYPGSALYRLAIERGLPLPFSWEGYSQYGYHTQPLPTRYLTAAEVLAFRDKAFERYFSDLSYQHSIERRFGKAALEEIRSMLSKRLTRRLLEDKIDKRR